MTTAELQRESPSRRKQRWQDQPLGIRLYVYINFAVIVCILFGWRLHGVTRALQLVLPWVLINGIALRPKLFAPTPGPMGSAPLLLLQNYWINVVTNTLAFIVGFQYVQLVGWTRLWVASAMAAVVLLTMVLADPNKQRQWWHWFGFAVLFLWSVPYGYATMEWLNVTLDRSPATIQKSTTAGKFWAYKGGPCLRVKPWGFISGVRDVEVSYALYKSVQPGDTVCLVVREGALRVPWYTAQACPWNRAEVQLGYFYDYWNGGTRNYSHDGKLSAEGGR